MRTKKSTAVVGALAGLSLLAAACGGDDGGGATGNTINEDMAKGVSDAVTGTTGQGAEAAKHPTSMEDWEALWKIERDAMVAKIKEAGGGLSADGTTLTGTGGFTVDISACQSGWSNTEGLTDTEIKIGQPIPLSGTFADYGNITKAEQVMFDDLNAKGGLTDSTGKSRKITAIVKDDGYDAARTIPLVDELIDSEKVFMVITLGSAPTLNTYGKLNQRCIPQPESLTGHPGLGDPVNHPWTTGLQIAYNTEAILWGSFIESHIDELAPDGGTATIAALVINNDFGKSYNQGLVDYINQSPIKDRIEYVTETIEPQAPTVTDAMTTLAASDPDMFIAELAGTACPQVVTEAAQNGMKESTDYLFLPSVCAVSSFVGKAVVGDAADGWWIVNGGAKDLNSPAFDDDAYVTFAREELTKAGVDPNSSGSLGNGYVFGWPLIQALDVAGQLDGGLNRTNFIIAWRAMNMTHPFLLEGIGFNMDGNQDAYLIEGGRYQKRDQAQEIWVDEGPVIDLSGKSKNCAWDAASSVCT